MSNVGRVDQAVLQLRAQLQRIARARAGGVRETAPADPSAVQRLKHASSAADFGEEEFRRKFVRALLLEEFGDAIGTQPEFEQISNQVWRLLEEDEQTRVLMEAAVRQLGGD